MLLYRKFPLFCPSFPPVCVTFLDQLDLLEWVTFLWMDLQTRVMNDNKKIGTLQPMDPLSLGRTQTPFFVPEPAENNTFVVYSNYMSGVPVNYLKVSSRVKNCHFSKFAIFRWLNGAHQELSFKKIFQGKKSTFHYSTNDPFTSLTLTFCLSF